MIINNILRKLKDLGVKHTVYTSEAIKDLLQNTYSPDNMQHISDARSAIFTAYGISKTSHQPVVALVDETELPSTYTGLTEAWFQRVPLIVLSYNSNSLDSSRYLERCVDYSTLIYDGSNVDADIRKIISSHGPSLIKVKEVIDVEIPNDYSDVIESIQIGKRDIKVFCYNAIKNNHKMVNIDSTYKYGVLSKYVGYLSSGKDSILIIPDDLLVLDSNIFNFRNFPPNFRLIVKAGKNHYWDRFKEWMLKNGVLLKEVNTPIDKNSMNNALNETPVAILIK